MLDERASVWLCVCACACMRTIGGLPSTSQSNPQLVQVRLELPSDPVVDQRVVLVGLQVRNIRTQQTLNLFNGQILLTHTHTLVFSFKIILRAI